MKRPLILIALFLLPLLIPNVHATTYQVGLSMDGPTLIFPGENVRWVFAVSLNGQPMTIDNVNAAVNCAVGCIHPTQIQVELINGTNTISVPAPTPTGNVYLLNYAAPANLAAGFYALVAFLTTNGTLQAPAAVVKGFQVSSTLEGYGATLTSINSNGTATLQTRIGEIDANVASLSPRITSINGNVVTLGTTLGHVNSTVTAINLVIGNVHNDAVTLNSDVGNFTGTLKSINGNVTQINTNFGTLVYNNAQRAFNDAANPSSNPNNIMVQAVQAGLNTQLIEIILGALAVISVLSLVFSVRAATRQFVPPRVIVQSPQSASGPAPYTPPPPPPRTAPPPTNPSASSALPVTQKKTSVTVPVPEDLTGLQDLILQSNTINERIDERIGGMYASAAERVSAIEALSALRKGKVTESQQALLRRDKAKLEDKVREGAK